MRLCRHLLAPCCAPRYQSVKKDDDLSPESEGLLSSLPLKIQNRVRDTLVEGEEILYLERQFQWKMLVFYSLVAALPLAFWLIFAALTRPAAAEAGARREALVVFVALSLLSLLLLSVYGTFQMARVCVVVTSHRLLKVTENGISEWIRWSDVSPLSRGETESCNKARFSIPSNDQNPLIGVTFPYVSSIPALRQIVRDKAFDMPCREAGGLNDPEQEVGPTVGGYVKEALGSSEQVLWCYAPSPLRISMFTASVVCLILTNTPWLFWAGLYLLHRHTLGLVFVSLTGLVVALGLAWLEWMQSRVLYIVTANRGISILYIENLTMCTFPWQQLRSYWEWEESPGVGQVGFIFRSDKNTAPCMTAERSVGRLLAPHLKTIPEDAWHIPVTCAGQFCDAVDRAVGSSGFDNQPLSTADDDLV
eukprot:TRINITY_DN623_c0_g1_i1.p1 TRINITY_DN623_c0_g1~~TRINITY_DN623_c0_g1_i1.p1  ORF type:complete len:434 (+),score=51.85 TRINITY_DN623_c0_g1_i1:45-1304(+)